MIFTTPLYAIYLVIVLLVYWLLFTGLVLLGRKSPKINRVKDLIMIIYLLIFSLLFYAAWDARYLILLVWVSVVDYSIGRLMEGTNTQKQRRFLLGISLVNDLGVLGLFKYFCFFRENVLKLIQFLSLEAHFQILELVLPIGISFYIFQSLSYVIDLYRKDIHAEKSYVHYLFFLSFFPQLVAGPIVTAKTFLPQLKTLLTFEKISFNFAFFLILMGAFKKAVLADHLAITSDFAFAHLGEVDSEFLWWGLLSYSGQIYCDFSGYTDIALGTALMFGFKLPENFRMPYLAKGFSDFWKRWHISLSTWLRSYLYFPLGGNRSGLGKTFRNLFLVMFLGGLWHGASWNFVIWGGGHGILLALERWSVGLSERLDVKLKLFQKGILSKMVDAGYRALTFFFVTLLWIFFRSKDFHESVAYLRGLFSKMEGISIPYSYYLTILWCFLAIILGHGLGIKFFPNHESFKPNLEQGRYTMVRYMALGAIYSLGFMLIVLLSGNSQPFVYFVF